MVSAVIADVVIIVGGIAVGHGVASVMNRARSSSLICPGDYREVVYNSWLFSSGTVLFDMIVIVE